MFGKDFSGNSDLRDEIAQAIIDKIVERTQEGLAIGGKKELRRPYSKDYIESSEFKDFNKKPSEVNMTLRGRMLDAIDETNTTTNTFKIKVDPGVETLKAFNHNVGDTVPKREFFGLRKFELDEIKKEFRADLKQLKNISKTSIIDKARTLASLLAEAETIQFTDELIGEQFQGLDFGTGEDQEPQ